MAEEDHGYGDMLLPEADRQRRQAEEAYRAQVAAEEAAKAAPDPLSDTDRARIRAEETYRAQVRDDAVAANRPGYWGGFIVNFLLTGVGFFLIGEVGYAVMWLLIAIIGNAVTSFIAAPFIIIGVLIHYRSVYARKYKTGRA